MDRRRKLMRRIEHPNHARFLTFSCYRRLPLFNNDAIKDAFVRHLAETRAKTGFHLLAWVVMPEHVHLLIWPRLPEFPVSVVCWRLKREFARRVVARWRDLSAPVLGVIQASDGRPRFWQRGGGYDRNIVDGPELAEKIRYINENPVRRGLVERATAWRWSSARWYAGERSGALMIDEARRPRG
jgi:putative transposase